MTNQELAKQKIADLIRKYHSLDSIKVKSFNEAATKQGFIQPLFEALGWDFSETDEVSPEDKTSNGRVDYAFKLHNVSQFYVEAKSFREDINDPKHIKQAVFCGLGFGFNAPQLASRHLAIIPLSAVCCIIPIILGKYLLPPSSLVNQPTTSISLVNEAQFDCRVPYGHKNGSLV